MADDTMAPIDLPAGSCDCQAHVFGASDRYPPIAKRAYDPPAAPFAELRAMHSSLGIERGVIVQATIYGTDHRLLLDTLKGRSNYRGVAVINDSVADDDLAALHRAGVRAARFGLGGSIVSSLTREEFERSIARIGALGWHAKIAASQDDLLKHESWIRDIRIPAVLDHFAGTDPSRNLDHPSCRLVLDLLAKPNWWIMLPNADRRSKQDTDWDDMVPFAQAFIAAAPGRTLWGTDWPHVLYAKPTVPPDRQLLAFLRRLAPDETTLRNILVDNPARLYGFA